MRALGFSLALRVSALAIKFVLTIVVARALGFAAVAAYGFALAGAVVASKVLGFGFSTELNRRLAGPSPREAVCSAKRLFALYSIAYAALCIPLAVPGWASGLLRVAALPHLPLVLVALIACAEHAALEVNTYLYSLHRTRVAAWLLFVRTGAWAGIAITGLATGAIESIEVLFGLWIGANVIVVGVGWRCIVRAASQWTSSPTKPSDQAASPPNASRGLVDVWLEGSPFFVALLLLSLLQYLERFVAAGMLPADALGRYVFVWSVANSIQTVAAATVALVAAPRFVRVCAEAPGELPRTIIRMLGTSLALTFAGATVIIALREPIFHLAHQGGDVADTWNLVILLLSFLLRALADVLWAAAVALRAGRAVALSMAGLALLCLPLSIALIRTLDAPGAAFAHLAASIAVSVTLIWIVASRCAHVVHRARADINATADARTVAAASAAREPTNA